MVWKVSQRRWHKSNTENCVEIDEKKGLYGKLYERVHTGWRNVHLRTAGRWGQIIESFVY